MRKYIIRLYPTIQSSRHCTQNTSLIQQFFLGALAVRGGCRMDYQRFYIGNVRQQGEQFQIVDEIFCFLCIAFDFEGEDGTAAVREVFLIKLLLNRTQAIMA